MNKRNYTLFFLAVFITGALSAQISTRLDLRLWKRLQDGNIRNRNMPLLIRGNMDAIKEITERYGGIYKYGFNNISSVEIPEKNLRAFSTEGAIERIENTGGKGVFLMDTARIRNNIDSIHSGFAPLSANLKGRNVVIGIIDGGIYFQHFDFRNPADSSTRIKYIWDQVAGGANPPLPFNYGNQWDWNDINSGNCTHSPPSNDFGHGTCVAGIAAGNSLSTQGTAHAGEFTGVAPEADIIAVRVDNTNFQAHVADAVSYIFSKADALGKPCVINTSLGSYYGSHDGIDLPTQLIEAQLDQHNGRVLVAAAGNAGNIPLHVGYLVPSDSAYTYFRYNPLDIANPLYFDFWADTADFNHAVFKVGASDTFGNAINSTTNFSVPVDFNPPQGGYNIVTRFLTNGASTDRVDMAASLYGTRYNVEFLISPSNVSNYWRLQTSGSGKLDLWANYNLIGGAEIVDYISPNTYITDPHYRHPDTSETMVTAWQNSDKVITVGNYSNRANYLDVDSNVFNLTNNLHNECFGAQVLYDETVGRRFRTSSFGPTRDGRLKPDIMATGSTIMCTADANNANLLLTANGGCNRFKVGIGGKHIRNGGTSMASPIVAGIAALYLEKRPTASYNEIKQALICTAVKDNFTGGSANFEYGNGKVNGFAALTSSTCVTFGSNDTSCFNYDLSADFDTGCVAKVYGVTDTGCVNYNPLANVNDGSCIPKIYGVMDTSCINYNPLANVSGGNCTPKVYGITDTSCINYNPLANVSDGICIPKVYGVMDTACINYNALANVSGGICTPKVYGVMDTACINFNQLANIAGGVCIPKVYGITDTSCINYNQFANVDSGICIAKVYGPTDTSCFNFNPLANTNNGTCVPKVYGVMDTSCINFDPQANETGGSCTPKVYGVTDTGCINYSQAANIDNGACISKIYGCTDSTATNYNPLANVDDGSCVHTSINPLMNDRITVEVFPNPFAEQTMFRIKGGNPEKGEIRIYNMLGSVVDLISVTNRKSEYIYQCGHLSRGIYHYLLTVDGRTLKTGKLVLE